MSILTEKKWAYIVVGYKIPLEKIVPISTEYYEVKTWVHDEICDNNEKKFNFCPDCGKNNYEHDMKSRNMYSFDNDLIGELDPEMLSDEIQKNVLVNGNYDFSFGVIPTNQTHCFIALAVYNFDTNKEIQISELAINESKKLDFEDSLSEKTMDFLKECSFGVHIEIN